MSKTKKNHGTKSAKKAKRVQSAERRVQSAKVRSFAAMEAQIAMLEEKIALLQQASDSRLQTSGSASNANPEVRSLNPEVSLATEIAANDATVTHLQTWLTDLQSMFENVAVLVPQLESTELNTTDRRRLNGSGVRRYGFIEKTADIAEDFPQFWPVIVDDKENLNVLVQEIEVLRNLLIWFRYASRVTGDLLLIAGDKALRLAGAYYAAARDGARRKNPEAQQVFNMLRSFWQTRRRNTSAEPTRKEVLCDVHALLRGTKDGEIIVRNESDRVVKGERVVIDNTRKTQSSKFQCHQRNSAVQSEGEVE